MAILAGLGAPLLVHAELAGPIDAAAVGLAGADPRRYATYLASRPRAANEANGSPTSGLEIFPDGGVARVWVHGEVVPRRSRLRALGGPIDLAALEHGAVVEACSDMFFGSRNNLIKPGPSRSMADSWETRRRARAGQRLGDRAARGGGDGGTKYHLIAPMFLAGAVAIDSLYAVNKHASVELPSRS